MKFTFGILLFSLILIQTIAHLTIEIEPEDIAQLSEILQSFITDGGQHITTRSLSRSVFHFVKLTSCSVVKLIGVMLTLVGANLLTTRMDHPTIVREIQSPPKTSPPSEFVCKQDIGCTSNLCWRTCDNPVNKQSGGLEPEKKAWCFTAENATATHHACTYAYQCSACWQCSRPCMY